MNLWDFDAGFRFQRISRARVYESHEIPICVFATKFDKSGKKLICSDSCNVVKIYSEAYSSRVSDFFFYIISSDEIKSTYGASCFRFFSHRKKKKREGFEVMIFSDLKLICY